MTTTCFSFLAIPFSSSWIISVLSHCFWCPSFHKCSAIFYFWDFFHYHIKFGFIGLSWVWSFCSTYIFISAFAMLLYIVYIQFFYYQISIFSLVFVSMLHSVFLIPCRCMVLSLYLLWFPDTLQMYGTITLPFVVSWLVWFNFWLLSSLWIQRGIHPFVLWFSELCVHSSLNSYECYHILGHGTIPII
jgi:hypothetical protein